MAWLAIIALAIWALVEHGRVSTLTRERDALRKRLAAASPAPRTSEAVRARPLPSPG